MAISYIVLISFLCMAKWTVHAGATQNKHWGLSKKYLQETSWILYACDHIHASDEVE